MRVSRRAILPDGPYALVIVPYRRETWVAMRFEHVVSIVPIRTRQRLATL